ncbi:MAG: DUF2520 domain-containing protein [Bacteroidales bacterium]|jgi:predicted short-subunit dehydrogenase-like oxidoreductase (DUF2520 family)|nr:DUF2520 domain-containing protein [Bacteroidales bacterium]
MEGKVIKTAFMIGAGNVAWHLSTALQQQGIAFSGIYNRTKASALQLAEKLQCAFFSSMHEIPNDVDIYFITTSDQSIVPISEELPENNGIVVHVSGSTAINVIDKKHQRRGVFYPLQTFNKEREVDFHKIPIAIEATNESDEKILERLALRLSETVISLTEEQRQALHVAAVFASNFTNYMHALSADILKSNHLDFRLLMPLIQETAKRAGETDNPFSAQTGPAVRNDLITIQKHLDFLFPNEKLKNIYQFLTEAIIKEYKQ